jgi:hypothetical protein
MCVPTTFAISYREERKLEYTQFYLLFVVSIDWNAVL